MYVKDWIWHDTAHNGRFKVFWSRLYQFSEILYHVTAEHAKNVFDLKRKKKIRAFSFGSASAAKLDVLFLVANSYFTMDIKGKKSRFHKRPYTVVWQNLHFRKQWKE